MLMLRCYIIVILCKELVSFCVHISYRKIVASEMMTAVLERLNSFAMYSWWVLHDWGVMGDSNTNWNWNSRANPRN